MGSDRSGREMVGNYGVANIGCLPMGSGGLVRETSMGTTEEVREDSGCSGTFNTSFAYTYPTITSHPCPTRCLHHHILTLLHTHHPAWDDRLLAASEGKYLHLQPETICGVVDLPRYPVLGLDLGSHQRCWESSNCWCNRRMVFPQVRRNPVLFPRTLLMFRDDPSHPDSLEVTQAAVHRATGTSLGSICLGAGIVATVRVVGRSAAELKRVTSPRSKLLPSSLGFLSKLTPFFAIIAGVLDQLNGYALVYVGITGEAFWPSARKAVGLAGKRSGGDLLDCELSDNVRRIWHSSFSKIRSSNCSLLLARQQWVFSREQLDICIWPIRSATQLMRQLLVCFVEAYRSWLSELEQLSLVMRESGFTISAPSSI